MVTGRVAALLDDLEQRDIDELDAVVAVLGRAQRLVRRTPAESSPQRRWNRWFVEEQHAERDAAHLVLLVRARALFLAAERHKVARLKVAGGEADRDALLAESVDAVAKWQYLVQPLRAELRSYVDTTDSFRALTSKQHAARRRSWSYEELRRLWLLEDALITADVPEAFAAPYLEWIERTSGEFVHELNALENDSVIRMRLLIAHALRVLQRTVRLQTPDPPRELRIHNASLDALIDAYHAIHSAREIALRLLNAEQRHGPVTSNVARRNLLNTMAFVMSCDRIAVTTLALRCELDASAAPALQEAQTTTQARREDFARLAATCGLDHTEFLRMQHLQTTGFLNSSDWFDDERASLAGRAENCQRAVVSGLAWTSGVAIPPGPATAASSLGLNTEPVYSWAYGPEHEGDERTYKFGALGSLAEVVARMEELGTGAKGVLRIARPTGSGHVCVVENVNGEIVFLEYQSGDMYSIDANGHLSGEPDGTTYALFVTHDPARPRSFESELEAARVAMGFMTIGPTITYQVLTEEAHHAPPDRALGR